MKSSTLSEIRNELEGRSSKELLAFCIRVAKFKKDNKDLLAFILFEENDIAHYTESVKTEMTAMFHEINNSNVYYIKKTVRKILRFANKQIKFAASKPVEAEILIHFCNCVLDFSIPLHKSRQLSKLNETVLMKIASIFDTLHPDLQYDLKKQLKINH